MKRVGVGVIGCGNISAAYLKAAKIFPASRHRRAGRRQSRRRRSARRRNSAFPRGRSRRCWPTRRSRSSSTSRFPTRMSKSACRPSRRASTSIRKSRSASIVAEAQTLVEAAAAKGVRLGCAPDTFLGGAHQTARKLIDEGLIGRPIGGTAFFMCPGHERWHPNPGFYYLARRRADARHGTLLHHRSRQSARPGRERQRRGDATARRTRDHQRTAEGTRIPVEVATHVTGIAAVRRAARRSASP